MKKPTQKRATDTPEFDRFQDLTRRLIAVPKKEIDKKAAEYERKKAKAKR